MRRFPVTRSLCLALALAICPGALPRATGQSTDASLAEQYLLAAANEERAALGLSILHRDPQLARAAEQHARTMASHQGISHQFPGEPELSARAASAGVRFSVVSENVGQAPSAVRLHDLWMHSTHHRANLLDPAIDSAGISVIARAGEFYAVEDFAKTVRSVSIQEQEAAIASLVARPGVLALDRTPGTIYAARQTCAMPTGYAGSRKPWFVMRFTSDSLSVLPAELKSRLASGRFHEAAVGACADQSHGPFTSYNIAVLLYP